MAAESRFPLRVLVAGEDLLARRGLVALLADCEELELVGESDRGQALLLAVAALAPEAVVLDLGSDEALEEQELQVYTPVLVLVEEVEHGAALLEPLTVRSGPALAV